MVPSHGMLMPLDYICEDSMMAKLGFIFLVLAIVIPCILSRTTKYDIWHFQISLAMYFFAMMGVAMLAFATQ